MIEFPSVLTVITVISPETCVYGCLGFSQYTSVSILLVTFELPSRLCSIDGHMVVNNILVTLESRCHTTRKTKRIIMKEKRIIIKKKKNWVQNVRVRSTFGARPTEAFSYPLVFLLFPYPLHRWSIVQIARTPLIIGWYFIFFSGSHCLSVSAITLITPSPSEEWRQRQRVFFGPFPNWLRKVQGQQLNAKLKFLYSFLVAN